MPCSAHPPPVRFSFNRLTTRDILLLNQRRNPLRMDPTRTTLIRSRFVADMRKRFRKLKRDVNEFMIQLDALGLKDRHSFLTGNQPQPREFEFRTDAGKVSAFNEWFRQQVEADVLSVPSGTPIGEPWTAKYVESAYRRGLANSYIASRQAGVAGELGILTQSQEAFLRSSFLQPETISKVELLATRSFEQLRGVTSQMGADMNRILAQGMADGRGPRAIAKEMTDRIDSMTRTRATVIARTECLPGDTLVDGAIVQKAFRRWYEGDLIEVKTRSGRKFSATPNHPMLTTDGWVAAGRLHPSHYLVCGISRQDSVLSTNPDVKRSPSKISEIFDALDAIGVSERVVSSEPDFHGDGRNGQIDVSGSDRELVIGTFAAIGKQLVKSSFTKSGGASSSFCPVCSRLLPVNERQCQCQGAEQPQFLKSFLNQTWIHLEALCYALTRFPCLVTTNNFIPSPLQDMIQLVWNTAFFPSQSLGLSIGSGGSSFSDHSLDPGFVSSFPVCDVPCCESGEVEFDNVLSVTIRQFRGHIYNLQTPVGYFTIDGGLYTGNTINAHAEGQLDAFEELGVEEVGVKAEWSTAGDDRVCSECAAMEGEVFEVSESHGLIPLHPNCRCAWIPAEEGAKATGRRPGVAGGDRGLIDEAAGKLGDIEGNSVVSVIRAAGAQGMTFQETKEMLSQAGFSSADQTIRIQLRAGKLGKGSLAPTSLLNRLRTGQIVGPTPVPTTTAPVPSAVRPGAVTPPATKGVKYRTAAEYREALLAPAEAAKSPELDRQRAELRQKTREISKLYADRNTLRHAGQDTSAISVQIREAEARRNALDSIVRSNDRGRSISAQEARELLMESDSLKGKVKLPDNLSKRDREAIEETLSMMPAKSYTAQEREALADLIVKTETDPNKLGSYQHPAPGWGATMRVKPEANVSTTVHEYAHHISYSVPRVMKDQNAFFNRRTAGESIAPLPGYNSSGKKDLFGKTDVYAGRVYSDGRYPEVIAVGVEELYKNPIRFATNDPEYFDMVVRTLKGID